MMGLMDYDVIDALRPRENQEVMYMLARLKQARLDDLIRGGLERRQVIESIDSLKKARLIEESSSVIPELSTYFVTAAGLRAARKL